MIFGSYLRVRVFYAVIHQHHDEDSDWNAKISDDPAKLRTRWNSGKRYSLSSTLNNNILLFIFKVIFIMTK